MKDTNLDKLRCLAANNALNFKGRNILNIIEKKFKQGKPAGFEPCGHGITGLIKTHNP